MKKGLRGKFQNKKGFTLVEMLIVVAIIAILIAVSIPLVSSALEKARDAVDDANYRSAAALGSIMYLTDPDTYATETEKVWYYKVDGGSAQGTLVAEAEKDEATKGQCTGSITGTCDAGGHTDKVIKVTIKSDGTVTLAWE